RLELGRAEIGPYDAAALLDWIRARTYLVLELRRGRLRRHIHAPPFAIELPAVIGAAQPALLVATKEELCAAVRAAGSKQADTAGAVAECDELLTEQRDAHRRA